jgi:hypothetical protein
MYRYITRSRSLAAEEVTQLYSYITSSRFDDPVRS